MTEVKQGALTPQRWFHFQISAIFFEYFFINITLTRTITVYELNISCRDEEKIVNTLPGHTYIRLNLGYLLLASV